MSGKQNWLLDPELTETMKEELLKAWVIWGQKNAAHVKIKVQIEANKQQKQKQHKKIHLGSISFLGLSSL